MSQDLNQDRRDFFVLVGTPVILGLIVIGFIYFIGHRMVTVPPPTHQPAITAPQQYRGALILQKHYFCTTILHYNEYLKQKRGTSSFSW